MCVRQEGSNRLLTVPQVDVMDILYYAPSHRQGSTYHDICYTSCWALAEKRINVSNKRDRTDYSLYLKWTLWIFYIMHHPIDRIVHTTTFVTPVVEHWVKRELMCPTRGIEPITHCTSSGRYGYFILCTIP